VKATTFHRSLARRSAVFGAALAVTLVAVSAVVFNAPARTKPGRDPSSNAVAAPASAAASSPDDAPPAPFVVQDATTGIHFEVVLTPGDPSLGQFIAAIPGVGLIAPTSPATVTTNADHTVSLSYSGAGSLDAAAQLDPELGSDYIPSGSAVAATLTLSGHVDPARQTASLDLSVNGGDHPFGTASVPDGTSAVNAIVAALTANNWAALYALADQQTHAAMTAQQYASTGAASGTFSHVTTNGPITYRTSEAGIHSAEVAINVTLTPPSGAPAPARGFIDLIDTAQGWQLYSITNPYTAAASASDCSLCVLSAGAPGAVTVSGAAQLNWAGAATVDSTSPVAIQGSGSAILFGGSLFTPGSTSVTGTAKLTTQTPTANGTATDPFASYALPTQTGTAIPLSVSGSSSQVANPGVYSQITVSGNGQLALSPGIYVITGQLTVSGSAKLSGSGVTIYLACPTYPSPCAGGTGAGVAVSGTASITLTDGATSSDSVSDSGFVLIADPMNPAGIAISASGIANLTGSLDAAAAAMAVTGNARLTVSSGQTVIGQLTVTGSSVVTVEGDQ
jgi:hypothetical protein